MAAKGGRSAYRARKQDRELVVVLVAAGQSRIAIAAALGIDVKTLRKHFAAELAGGGTAANARVIAAVHASAVDGSAAAQRLWLTVLAKPRMDPVFMPGAAPKPIRPAKLGKKEVAQASAERAAADPNNIFAPPPAPRLVVDNGKG